MSFPHHRLHVYRLALELAKEARCVADRVPRGYRGLADQLIRSGPAVALLVAEGANRYSSAQKRQRFVEARGECGEAAATVEVLRVMGIVSDADQVRFEGVAAQIGRMLTALIKRHS
jgi:four helix bundle protein